MMIRIAELSDAGKMLDIYAWYVLNSAASFECAVPSEKEFAQRMKKIQPEFPWLVYRKDGDDIGYAYASRTFDRAAYRWNASVSIYVTEKYHGTGVAALLYELMEKMLSLQGYYYLYAGITASNAASIRFVEKHGYIKTAVYPNSGFKLGEWHDVVWYYKNLRIPQGEPLPPIAFVEMAKEQVKALIDIYNDKMSF